MTNHDEIYSLLNQLSTRLSGIEKTINTIAVQEEKINSLKTQVDGMWKKYDKTFGPDGPIVQLKEHYASCPKENIKINIARQWVAIGFIGTLITALKLWG